MRETIRLVCQGYSDDTFGIYGPGIDVDHDNCASGKPMQFRVEAGGESLLVVGQYAPGDCAGWLLGISPDGESDTPIPDWPMSFTRGDVPYSPALVIEVPHDVKVEYVG